MIQIDIKPFLDNIKSQLTTGVKAELQGVQVAIVEYVADAEVRLAALADGAASGGFSYAFVIKRLKEEQVNLYDEVLSLASGAMADAENLAKTVVGAFEDFLKDQIIKNS